MGDEATAPGDGSATVPDGLQQDGLEAWFAANASECTPPLEFERIAGGLSNLTYRVQECRRRRWALRRPPLGKRLGSAHDMGPRAQGRRGAGGERGAGGAGGRALRGRGGDRSPLLRDGVRPRARSSAASAEAELFPDHADRRAIGCGWPRRWRPSTPSTPTPPGSATSRSKALRRLRHCAAGRAWEKSKTRELPTIDRVHDRLAARIRRRPGDDRPGDYRLDNMILTPSGEVAAVVDWELCTLGDPLADVGTLNGLLARARARQQLRLGEPANLAPGFPSREELAARYAERSAATSPSSATTCTRLLELAIILEGSTRLSRAAAYGEVDEGVPRLQSAGRAAGRNASERAERT